jgi:GntR family transcriptional regulator, transcriptional repressor for pyruvate dehydrogenase complex
MVLELKQERTERVRVSDQIKNALKQAILDGVYHPGDRLPTEIQLAEQFNTSKVSAREALREMETEKLIEKRRGMYGGSFVVEPDGRAMGQVMINFYKFGRMTLEELAEFRRLLEPALIELAVERRTEADLVAIRENLTALTHAIDQGQQDQARALEFHRLLSVACHNSLITAVMESLIKVFQEILSTVPMTLEDAQGDLAYSRELYKHLKNRDRVAARQTMEAHFDTLMTIIERIRNSQV